MTARDQSNFRTVQLGQQQLVQPLPDPWIPVCNTNKIPHNTCRAGIRFRPGYRGFRGAGWGSNGYHSPSGTTHGGWAGQLYDVGQHNAERYHVIQSSDPPRADYPQRLQHA